jgi:hypothetical protein
VRKKKMIVYIGIQRNKLAESRLIVNLFFSQLINVNTKELPQNNPALQYRCLLMVKAPGRNQEVFPYEDIAHRVDFIHDCLKGVPMR